MSDRECQQVWFALVGPLYVVMLFVLGLTAVHASRPVVYSDVLAECALPWKRIGKDSLASSAGRATEKLVREFFAGHDRTLWNYVYVDPKDNATVLVLSPDMPILALHAQDAALFFCPAAPFPCAAPQTFESTERRAECI